MKIIFILFFLFITNINVKAEIKTYNYNITNDKLVSFVTRNPTIENTSGSESKEKSASSGILETIFDMIKSLYEMFKNLLKTLIGQLKTTLNTKSDVM